MMNRRVRVALALAEKEPRRAVEQMQRIEIETERLDELIGQLLSVPDTQTEMEDSIDLVGLLQVLCADAHFEAQTVDKRIDFNTALDEAILRTHGDLLSKAIENVIRNAMHYTASGSTVRVKLFELENVWLIEVEDAGPGIPDEDLERIFQPFYRIDEARQRETGGFGLGLSIARRAVEQHGGSIFAANTGQGLQVSISLPA